MSMLDSITAERFEAVAGQTLRLDAADATTTVTITSIRRLPPHGARATPPFSVLLQAAGIQRPWPQGNYRLTFPDGDACELFMVPVAADGDGVTFEAIIN